MSLYVDPENVPQVETEDDLKVYAKLEVTCPPLNNFQEEKDVLISYEEGFVFIQTDKPIYTPDQRGMGSCMFKKFLISVTFVCKL